MGTRIRREGNGQAVVTAGPRSAAVTHAHPEAAAGAVAVAVAAARTGAGAVPASWLDACEPLPAWTDGPAMP